MTLNSKEIEAILGSSLILDFVNITLTQQKIDETKIYTGPGSILQDKDGILRLKMYCSFQSDEEMIPESCDYLNGGNFTPGKIIEGHNYYSLEAIDMKGRAWKANGIRMSSHISFPARGKVIETSMRSISSVSDRYEGEDKSKSRAVLLIPGKYEIPCNKYEETKNSSSLSICSLALQNCECEIKRRDNHLDVSVNIPEALDAESLSSIILEAISIGTGSFLRPQMKMVACKESRTTTIFSRKIETNKDKLQPPIPNNPHDVILLTEFIDKYLTSFIKPYSKFFGYWFRILCESHGELENRALVLSTSIEGVLKEYYSDYGVPEAEFLEQASSAIVKIKNLDIGEKAKSRILSTLGNAKSATPKNALYSLSRKKIISEDLINSWVTLRNKSAHADELQKNNEELQAALDQIFCCQELFYLLLLNYINYCGEFIQFSKEGWPISLRKANA